MMLMSSKGIATSLEMTNVFLCDYATVLCNLLNKVVH